MQVSQRLQAVAFRRLRLLPLSHQELILHLLHLHVLHLHLHLGLLHGVQVAAERHLERRRSAAVAAAEVGAVDEVELGQRDLAMHELFIGLEGR